MQTCTHFLVVLSENYSGLGCKHSETHLLILESAQLYYGQKLTQRLEELSANVLEGQLDAVTHYFVLSLPK